MKYSPNNKLKFSELSPYFATITDGNTIMIWLSGDIPEQSLPSNGIIILELQASAVSTISAYTTIIFEVIQEDSPTSIELMFEQTYYTGHYTETNGLVFETNMRLVQGYEEDVQFALEGGMFKLNEWAQVLSPFCRWYNFKSFHSQTILNGSGQ